MRLRARGAGCTVRWAVCVARAVLGAAMLVELFAAVASAQTARRDERKAEVDVGLVWTGGGSFGSRAASLTAPDGSPYVLFSTTNEISAGVGPEAHLTFRVTRHLRAEATGSWTRPELRSRISSDVEGVGAITSTLGVSAFTAEGSAVWCFQRRGKLEPFLRGGAGWLRELTRDKLLSANAVIASGGGGVKYWWRERDRGLLKRLGLRLDLRLVTRSGGLSLGTGRRLISPAATMGAIVGF